MALRRCTRSVDGTIPVSALLYDDEELFASQGDVGVYDGYVLTLLHLLRSSSGHSYLCVANSLSNLGCNCHPCTSQSTEILRSPSWFCPRYDPPIVLHRSKQRAVPFFRDGFIPRDTNGILRGSLQILPKNHLTPLSSEFTFASKK
jgi:hypothetical protein